MSLALFDGWPPEAVGTIVAAVVAGMVAAITAIVSAVITRESNKRTVAATRSAARTSADSAKEAAQIAADISRREGDRRQVWLEFTWAMERGMSDDERSVQAGFLVLQSLLSVDWMDDRHLELVVKARDMIEARQQQGRS